MKQLRTYTTTFTDTCDGELVDPDTTEDVQDCTPDQYDTDDGLTAVDLAVKYLQDNGVTETSTSPVPATGSMTGIWFSYVDGSYVSDYYTGERTELSAHPEGFTDSEVRAIAYLVGARSHGDTGAITFWHHAALGRELGWETPRARRTASGHYIMALDVYNRSHTKRLSLDDSIQSWVNGYDAAMAQVECDAERTAAIERYAAVSRVGTGPVPPAE